MIGVARVAARFALVTAALAALACNPTFAKELDTFRVIGPLPAGGVYRTIYIGIEKGWFRDAGIKVELQLVPGGAVNTVPQIAEGNGDLAYAGGYTVIQARARGLPVVAVNAASTETLWALIVSRKSHIKTPEDLKGKTIGVLAFSGADYFIARGLVKAGGLSESEVNIRPIGLAGPAALAKGQVDGYVWFLTQGLALKLRGAPVETLRVDKYIPIPQDAMLVTEKTIQEKPQDIRAFMSVLHRASVYDDDPAHWAEDNAYQAKYAPDSVRDKAFLKAINEFNRARTARDNAKGWVWGSTDPKRFAAAQKFLIELGVIKHPTPVDKMYSNAFLPGSSNAKSTR